jgi:hypothetical protein
MKSTLESLHKAGVNFSVFDNVRIEPTDHRSVSLKIELQFGKSFMWGNIFESRKRLYLKIRTKVREEEEFYESIISIVSDRDRD